jgi:hypothetical protein
MDDEYKLKREKNNQSVKKCRENEKRKVEEATEKLEEYKRENKSLEDKYSNLQKELAVLKSLFSQSTATASENSDQTSSSSMDQNQVVSNMKDPFNL